jgi:hypothetical protein
VSQAGTACALVTTFVMLRVIGGAGVFAILRVIGGTGVEIQRSGASLQMRP